MSKPEILNILVDNVVENLDSTITPVVKWQYYDLDNLQRSYILKVGTAPGKNDILDTGEIFTDFNEYVITPIGYDASLKHGIRYYITLQVSNEAFDYSDELQTFLVTDGEYWNDHVDNSMGWTVEYYFKINSDVSQKEYDEMSKVESPEVDLLHHNVDIRDGARLASIEMYVDRIIVRSSQSVSYFIDNRKFHLYRVTGQGDDLKIYIDGILQLNFNGNNTIPSDVKSITFGAVTNELTINSTWCSIFMDLSSSNPPSDLPTGFDVTSFFFYNEDFVDTQLDLINRDKIYVGTNPVDIDNPGKVYELYKNSQSIKRDGRPFLNFEALNVITDSRGSKWANTRNNVFKISGEFGGEFSREYTFESEAELTEFFRASNCSGNCATFGNLLRVNTINEPMDAFWYYETVKNANSDWYNSVDNATGWTVEAEVRIADDGSSISESSGIIINDGAHSEIIYVFKNRICLKNANIEAFYDFFTQPVQLRIVGIGNDIRVYVKVVEWVLLIDGSGSFTGEAQILSDSGSMSSGVYSSKKLMTIWHSNKDGYWQLFSNQHNGILWESEQRLTYSDSNSLNPDIFIDNYDHTHIVYQDDAFGNNEIFYAKYNGVNLTTPIRITDSVMDSITPKIRATDNGDIYVIWLDNRNSNYEVYSAKYNAELNSWECSGLGGDDEKISDFGSSYDAKNIDLKSSSSAVYATWNDNRNIVESIYLNCNFGNDWKGDLLVSSGVNGASDPSSIVDSSGLLNICWRDERNISSEIYYITYDNIGFGIEERISNTPLESSNPCISEYSNDNLAVYWLESSGTSKSINLGTINNGVVNSSGGGGSDIVMSNSSVNDISSLTCLNLQLNESNVLFYLGSKDYQTIYSYRVGLDNVSSIDLEDSVKVSNLQPSKSLSFGDISNYNRTASEWGVFKYSVDGVIDGLIVKGRHIEGVIDIHADDEDILYVLSYEGLEMFRMYFEGDDFITSPQFFIKASSSPIGIKKISTFSDGSIVSIDDHSLYFSYPLSSSLNDQDMPWLKINFDLKNDGEYFSLGKLLSLNVIDGLLWVGGENGMISASKDDIIINNIIDDTNSTLGLIGKSVNSFDSYESIMWISHNFGVSRYIRSTGSETVITVADGLIDKNVDKVIAFDSNSFWALGRNGLSKWEDGVSSIYRNITASNNNNDFTLADGGVWIANDLGVEFFKDGNSFIVGETDGYSVIDSFDNYKIYKYDSQSMFDHNEKVVKEDDYKIVVINGVFRDPSEYIIDTNNDLIIFRDALNYNSTVRLINYTNSKLIYDFGDPNLVLGIPSGSSSPRILELTYDANNNLIIILNIDGDSYVYATDGDRSVNGGVFTYPFDSIIMDSTPPVGTMDIVDQISATEVELKINASDNVSGVDKMVLSNFQNFTIDGVIPSPELDYSTSAVWDLGASGSNGTISHEFTQGLGNVILTVTIPNDNGSTRDSMLVGTTDGAFLYMFDIEFRVWNLVQSFVGEEVSDIIFVGSQGDSESSKVYLCTSNPGALYSSDDGITYQLVWSFVDDLVKTIYAASDGYIYVGTGTEGRLYRYSEPGVFTPAGGAELVFDLGESTIYDITEFSGFLYLATGDAGRIYKFNLATMAIEIIYDDKDAKILSINTSRDFNSDSLTVYAGTDPSGKILRLIRSRSLFTKSFQSNNLSCRRLRTLGNTEETYACIDNKLFQFNQSNWKGIYVDDLSEVMDVAFLNDQLYILTEGEIRYIEVTLDYAVYIKFIDFAGNETTLYNSEGELKPRVESEETEVVEGDEVIVVADEILSSERLWDTVSIDELDGFSLQGRLITYDANGRIIKTLKGSTPYLTGGRVDEEKAIYVSEQFDGTNNLVSWDTVAYSGSIPTGTEIVLRIKTYDDIDGRDNVSWSEPVLSGADVSGLSGRFFQFQATLSSVVRGITPVLNNVTITAKTTFGVHYFTTNFVLPSNLRSGILTANVVKPDATEIVFGIGTDSSTNWNNYQIIPTEKLFVIDEDKRDQNLRVGVRFLSSAEEAPELHEFALIFSMENGEMIKLNI